MPTRIVPADEEKKWDFVASSIIIPSAPAPMLRKAASCSRQHYLFPSGHRQRRNHLCEDLYSGGRGSAPDHSEQPAVACRYGRPGLFPKVLRGRWSSVLLLDDHLGSNTGFTTRLHHRRPFWNSQYCRDVYCHRAASRQRWTHGNQVIHCHDQPSALLFTSSTQLTPARLAVTLPALPQVQLTGLEPIIDAAAQPRLELSLSSPYW